jgi:DNA primase
MIPRQRFDKARLPGPESYYASELGALQGSGTWRNAVCCFHPDTRPSLRVNVQTGAFKCMSCGAAGGDVLSFQMRRYGQTFPAAAKVLGAWKEARHD